MPSSRFQPPIVTIATSAALTSSSVTTMARLPCTTGLSRLGCVTITSRRSFGADTDDIANTTIQPRAAEVGSHQPRGRGGIGRHAGLRSRWAKALGGSSPLARTIIVGLKPPRLETAGGPAPTEAD